MGTSAQELRYAQIAYETAQAMADSARSEAWHWGTASRGTLRDERREALEVQGAQFVGLQGEERRSRVQLGEAQARRRVSEAAYSLACA